MKTLLTILLRSSPPLNSPHFLVYYSTAANKLHPKTGEVSIEGRAPSSSSSRPFSSSSSENTNDEDLSRNVKVSVWWDFENCPVPNGINSLRVSKNITAALRANGIKGPVSITAFGDFIQLSRSAQESLSLTGISLNHVPSSGKNTADRSLLSDLVFWVSQNPPPAHLFLISGDKDFANILHRLRMNNYNILLASKDPAPDVLCSAASIMWRWYHLVRGESFSGKHFNEPPDGPWESWYGKNRGPLKDPFPDTEHSTCVQAEDFLEAGAGSKPRVVPKAIVNRIRQVLNSYPKGLAISELRSELGRTNVPMDKDFFGYKKFSLLLRSLPTVLRLQSSCDGQIFVHGIQPKVADPVGPVKFVEPLIQEKATGPLVQPKVAESFDQQKAPGSLDQSKIAEPFDSKVRPSMDPESDANRRRKGFVTKIVNEESSLPADSPLKIDPPPVDPKKGSMQPMAGHVSSTEQIDSITEVGFFPRVWRTVCGHNDDGSKKNSNSPEISSAGADCSEEREPNEKTVLGSLSSSNSNEFAPESKTSESSEEEGKPSPQVGIFGQILKWFRPWKTSTTSYNTGRNFVEEVDKSNSQTDNIELFSKVDFWEDTLSFLQSSKGTALISQSKTREQMAQKLQKDGPTHLNTLAIGDLSHLVDLLISEKKCLEESNSRSFPFQLIRPAQNSSSSFNPQSSNGLSSIFSGKSSQPNLRRPSDHLRISGKSKDEILAQCQKLVAEMLKERPEGFNLGSFTTSFRERYGHYLDYQKLGYRKLADLLLTIPGVAIDSNYVLPSEKPSKTVVPYSVENDGILKVINSDSESSDSSEKDNNHDVLWGELGAVFEPKRESNCSRTGIKGETNERIELVDFESSDEFTDSEGESPIKDGSDGEKLPGNSEGGSSLFKVLESYYEKSDQGNKDRLHDSDEVMGCSRSFLNHSSEIAQNRGRKNPRKNFSFIADADRDEKETLLNGIMGTLKKSSDSKLQG